MDRGEEEEKRKVRKVVIFLCVSPGGGHGAHCCEEQIVFVPSRLSAASTPRRFGWRRAPRLLSVRGGDVTGENARALGHMMQQSLIIYTMTWLNTDSMDKPL